MDGMAILTFFFQKYRELWRVVMHNLSEISFLIQLFSPFNITAIRLAAERGHAEVVKILLQDDRVDPSTQHNFGKNA